MGKLLINGCFSRLFMPWPGGIIIKFAQQARKYPIISVTASCSAGICQNLLQLTSHQRLLGALQTSCHWAALLITSLCALWALIATLPGCLRDAFSPDCRPSVHWSLLPDPRVSKNLEPGPAPWSAAEWGWHLWVKPVMQIIQTRNRSQAQGPIRRLHLHNLTDSIFELVSDWERLFELLYLGLITAIYLHDNSPNSEVSCYQSIVTMISGLCDNSHTFYTHWTKSLHLPFHFLMHNWFLISTRWSALDSDICPVLSSAYVTRRLLTRAWGGYLVTRSF